MPMGRRLRVMDAIYKGLIRLIKIKLVLSLPGGEDLGRYKPVASHSTRPRFELITSYDTSYHHGAAQPRWSYRR